MRVKTRTLVGVGMASVWLLGVSSVRAQVSCANPDNLCTGDPCVIGQSVTVLSPCVVDFGARTLVIAARVNVPNDGMLSFTAAVIDSRADIDGRHLDGGSGSGGEVELHATAGSATLRGGIDVSGTLDVGSIAVTASGDILLDDRLDAKAVGSSATGPGGDVTLDAGGTLTVTRSSAIDVRSANDGTPGGSVTLEGDAGVELGGKVDASGSSGGGVSVTSSSGAVTVGQSIRARGESDVGGSVSVAAAGTVTLAKKPIDVQGTTGGQIDLSSSAGDVVVAPILSARGFTQDGGLITVVAAGSFTASRRIDARGAMTGGQVGLIAPALQVLAPVRVTAGQQGGAIVLIGDTVSLNRGRLEAQAGLSGGSVIISALVLADLVRGTARVDADQGGTIQISGAAVNVTSIADLEADGSGGLVCLKATAGNMLVDGDLMARPGGVIEAAASGDLTASGRFRTSPGGCIGLSAGGTLSTVGGSFDPAPSPSCGMCP